MLNLIVYNAKTGQALSVQQCKSLVWLRLYSKFPQTLVVTSVFFLLSVAQGELSPCCAWKRKVCFQSLA
jgi:hypothetical protein